MAGGKSKTKLTCLLKRFQTRLELLRLLILRLSRFLLSLLKQRFCKFVMSALVFRIELDRGLESLNRSLNISFLHSSSARVQREHRRLHVRLFFVQPGRLLKLRPGRFNFALLTETSSNGVVNLRSIG